MVESCQETGDKIADKVKQYDESFSSPPTSEVLWGYSSESSDCG